jgi:S-formylglutathione hydrolase FrmB
MKKVTFLFLFMSLFIFSAGDLLHASRPHKFSYAGAVEPGKWLRNLKVVYSEEKDGFRYVQIFFPKDYKKGENARVLIALHGYGANLREWELYSTIEKLANDLNFVIVCPDMGNSIYESNFYPETTVKWAGIPGGKFISETLINYLNNTFALAYDRDKTGIFGLSTGGRGAMLLSALHTDIFGAAAGLSGDYDPLAMPRDRLITSVYGNFKQFEERWKTDDNIMQLADKLINTPLFISHGDKDSVVPIDQSLIFALKLKHLKKKMGGFDVTYVEKKYSMHDWRYWGQMLPEVMDFFNKKLKK